jgi:hypothetical protein
MEYLIVFSVVAIMALYVLILARCLRHAESHKRATEIEPLDRLGLRLANWRVGLGFRQN